MEVSDFEDFFRATYPKLVRYAQRRVDPEQAEDLATAALQALWAKDLSASPRGGDDRPALESLAYHILRGLLRNAWRAEASFRNAVHALERQHDAGRYEPDIVDQIMSNRWPAWAQTLPATDREVLQLVVDGYKVNEIAVILDCTPAAVSMRIYRAKEKVRQLWMEEVGDEQP